MMDAERIFAMAIGVLILFYLAFGIFMTRPPKKVRPLKIAYQDLGRAGDSQRHYKPQRNIHRIINHIVSGEVKAFPNNEKVTK